MAKESKAKSKAKSKSKAKARASAGEKKTGKRQSLASSALKRLLKMGAGSTKEHKVRVSSKAKADAVKATRDALKVFLHDLGRASRASVENRKAKTLARKDLKSSLESMNRCGLRLSDMERPQAVGGKASKGRNLSETGVRKAFREGYGGKELRISDKASYSLLLLANDFVKNLGRVSRRIMEASHRQTILSQDIGAALECTRQ